MKTKNDTPTSYDETAAQSVTPDTAPDEVCDADLEDVAGGCHDDGTGMLPPYIVPTLPR